ncbi:MAG: PQQ-dependent sugar dehydrogenase [Pseudomonadales bacterium]|nr:PQQ-dependent sugar dehydrogenase [Pseudomonadales bacterium]
MDKIGNLDLRRTLRAVSAVLVVAVTLSACNSPVDGSRTPRDGVPPPTQPPPAADTTAPSVPQNVVATAQPNGSIQLNWQGSTDNAGGAGVAGYRVFRDSGATPLASVAGTSYTDVNLAPATSYSYTVRAFDAATPANESGSSIAASATTPTVVTPPNPPVSGLDTRPSNATCVAGDRPVVSTSLALERVFPGLSFNSPVAMLQAPADGTRWFVVQQNGVVRAFANQANPTVSDFADLSAHAGFTSGGETGLLGMAFHPDFPIDPRVYLSYTANVGGLVSRVSEFHVIGSGARVDLASEVVLLSVPQPASNHNGGHIVFGPDGFLYIGLGDGGGGGDPFGAIGNGQNLRTLLGKMLRIDISGSTGSVPYRIPAGNPYAATSSLCNGGSGAANCPEIYAYGLRNPWRWSFDRGSGELWLADVGQDRLEEVDRVTAGGNYGWRCFEGADAYNSTCGPNSASSIPPIAQYGRTLGQSITGGYVYRGSLIPSLVGQFVFGDFNTGRLWHLARDTAPTLTITDGGLATNLQISSFGQGVDGELYVVHYGGTLHRLVAGTSASGGSIPAQLSATGCVATGNATQPAAGLIPYTPRASFWSDGLAKQRYLALPNGASLGVDATGDFQFPNGSVLVKNFSLGSRLVETRLFMRHTDGEWAGYTYEWNAQGTDATRVVGGKTVQIGAQSYQFPSEAQCLTCHTAAAGRSLGLELAQLNHDTMYAATGRTANQLVTLNTIGLIAPALSATQLATPALPDPYGISGGVSERARAYLHSNCSNCHRPGAGTPSNLDLRYSTPLAATNACDAPPQAGDLGLTNARIIAPGAAARSVLVARVNRRDAQAMPPLSSTVVDAAGVTLLTSWIDSLSNCN